MSKVTRVGLWTAGLLVGGLTLLLVCAGGVFILQATYYLLLGWVQYLVRVVPEIRPDPTIVATAAACLVAVTVGCHWLGGWFWSNLRPDSRSWSWRWTGRVVATVVLLFVAGTAAVGIVHQSLWLATAKEPLIDGGMRPFTARNASNNNMKLMGLAAHNGLDATGFLPVSTFTLGGRPMHSWQTALLPYLDEQQNTYSSINLLKPWDHSANREATAKTVKVYLHPAVEAVHSPSGFALSHYSANVLVLGGDRKRKMVDFHEKGLSNTILYGEAVHNSRAWADPLNWRDPRLGIGHPYGFGGPAAPKKTQFCMLDGSVQTLDLDQLKELLKDGPE